MKKGSSPTSPILITLGTKMRSETDNEVDEIITRCVHACFS